MEQIILGKDENLLKRYVYSTQIFYTKESNKNTRYTYIEGEITWQNIGDKIGAIEDNNDLVEIRIGKAATSIGDSAFYDCNNLSSVYIPNSISVINDSAFTGCSALTSINIPDSVLSIYDWAFANCEKLTSITIPSSVQHLGYAFNNCPNLKQVIFEGKKLSTIQNFAEYPFGVDESYIIVK